LVARALQVNLVLAIPLLSLDDLQLRLRAATMNTARGAAIFERTFEVLFLVAAGGSISILLLKPRLGLDETLVQLLALDIVAEITLILRSQHRRLL
jgi:hypothetical protein